VLFAFFFAAGLVRQEEPQLQMSFGNTGFERSSEGLLGTNIVAGILDEQQPKIISRLRVPLVDSRPYA
jgi:hypothetical protein